MKSLKESIFDKDLATKHLDEVTLIINELKNYPEGTKTNWNTWWKSFKYMTNFLRKEDAEFRNKNKINELPKDKCLIGESSWQEDMGKLFMICYMGDSKPWLFIFTMSTGVNEVFSEVFTTQDDNYWGIVKKVPWAEYDFGKDERKNFEEMIKDILKVF